MGSGPSFPIVSLPKERVIMVTGANSGLGYEIAKWSAMMGATVILAGQSGDETRQAMTRMQEEFETEKRNGMTGLYDGDNLNIESMELELNSFKSVLQFCEDFKKSRRHLHVLFCNAGIGVTPHRITEDGFEQVLQVNYLSHFIMIAKFLSIMKKSGPDCRILFMSSSAHRRGTFDLDTMNYTGPADNFSHWNYYGRTKLYMIMQTFAMSRRLNGSNISVNSVHPGIVATQFGRDAASVSNMWKVAKWFTSIVNISRTPLKGAACPIDLTVNPKHAGVSGHYWIDGNIAEPSSTARNEQKQEQLWKKTFEYVKQYLTEEEVLAMEGK